MPTVTTPRIEKDNTSLQRRSRRKFLAAASLAVAAPHVVAAESGSRIRIGQIGTTHAHAAGKLSALRNLEDLFEVVGVVEPDRERRSELAETDAYRDVRWVEEEELLNTAGVKAVAVETDVGQLVGTALRCVRAGLHVHLDKPAGLAMAPFRQLCEEADARERTIQMGYMLRYNPAFETLFRMVSDGWLGDVTEINGAMGKLASPKLRRELAQYPGGGMFELACHLIDAMVTVLGPPNRVVSHNRRSRREEDSFLDNQLAVYEYTTAVATIRCNHVDPFGFARRFFEVAGTEGHYRIDPLESPKARVALDRAHGSFSKGVTDVTLRETSGRYDDEFRDLARVIRGEKQLQWDRAHDLAVHRAILLGSGAIGDAED